ncbi:hypothetical protein EDC01DRAFT_782805 [Geopyxis carbonaria]|nr:hypothetical protein EDC01DRAFT_782805 [Geopyxis carbonaria]
MRLSSLLSAAFLLVSAAAQDPNGGTHSDHFDARKYAFLDRLLVTPVSHPRLYSFTGRWLRSPTAHPYAPAYHSTLWPGNSVTVLFFGERASLKLLPQPQGPVEHYSFVVSIDGGDDVRYDTPGFDTSAPNPDGHYIPLELNPSTTAGSPQKRAAKKLLEPHTVRITSMADTPLSFEGLLVENTQVNQGQAWADQQALRPTLEFIGEGLDAERPGGFHRSEPYTPAVGEAQESPKTALFSTTHYVLAETLGVRHYQISAGVCLLSACDSRKLPGLESQYWQTSPLDWRGKAPPEDKFSPHHTSNLVTPWRFPAVSTAPPVPVNPTTHVIVDLGVLDVLMNHADPAAYTHALTLFLARLRTRAHPAAKVIVIGHRGTPAASVLPANPATAQLRDTLFAATQSAVAALADPATVFAPVALSARDPAETSYLRAICPHLLPPPSIVAKTKAIFVKSASITRAQRVCLQLDEVTYRRGARGVFWVVVLGALALAGLWVAKSTVIGALAAVVGRKRLGMVEESEGLLENGMGANGRRKDG